MRLARIIRLCAFSIPLLTGCRHKSLTPGQNLLLTAPTSSKPVLRTRTP